MSLFPLKPTHKPVIAYYAALKQFHLHGHDTEGNTRSAFADLLKKCASPYKWHLVEEFPFKGTGKQNLRADGAIFDNDLPVLQGLWEAKDTNDDLDREIKSKVAKGYPLSNTIFQSPDRAVLYQDNRIAFDDTIASSDKLIEVLECFFNHKLADIPDWEEAVTRFADEIPKLAQGVTTILEAEDKKNSAFRENFQSFAELCRQSINPDLTDDAIRKMLVQHLLTERIFRKVFNNQEFLQRNVIAAEIEKVIRSITARHFSRDEFLKPLDRFYTAIEKAAESQTGYTEKQHFLNAVYEKFFQRFDTKQADTHGIVYTPQPIVDFMVRSVEEILQQEFGKSLSDSGVHILDPFTGTGNFITRIMQQIKRSALPQKYAEELHCNEIMLLPYYIASMNIEHAYMERVGEYSPFEGICLADTFDLSERRQAGLAFMNIANTARVDTQKAATIFAIVGNPPYNAGQDVSNDNNPNREYEAMHERIWETYAARSDATLLSTLDDPYIQAFRWATDRLRNEDGVIAYVSNGRFIAGKATDGMRKCLALEFDKLYVVDLGGDVRSNPKISGTTHNVFGIQAGIAITILVRTRHAGQTISPAQIKLTRTPLLARKGEKLTLLENLSVKSESWEDVVPASDGSWRLDQDKYDWDDLLSVANKKDKAKAAGLAETIFQTFSAGCKTNRDPWTFNHSAVVLETSIARSVDFYNKSLSALPTRKVKKAELIKLVPTDDQEIAWSDDLRASLARKDQARFDRSHIRQSASRPYTVQYLYFDRLFNDRVLLNPRFFGEPGEPLDNLAIGITSHS
jgi:predicted helicase